MFEIQKRHRELWESSYLLDGGAPDYDLWLDAYNDILSDNSGCQIIDLGCGDGNNAKYLIERGHSVICCDFSVNALNRVKKYLPEAQTLCFDMLDGLPFMQGSAAILVADLSLHYFSEAQTRFVIQEILRILKPEGYLFCRVNSINDLHYGAGMGREIERHFYEIEGHCLKRFFDEEDIRRLFPEKSLLNVREYEMKRYKMPKVLWEIVMKK